MTRSLWINIHLYIAALFAPVFVLVGISGGLYLIGIKGSVSQTPVSLAANVVLDAKSATLADDVRQVLAAADIDHSFEYIKVSGNRLYTRPTSKVHYEFSLNDGGVTATRNQPDLQKRMIELHKGHGPTAFKTLQKFVAVGLVITVLSGLWLGLSAPALRAKSLGLSGAGLLLFILVGFVL